MEYEGLKSLILKSVNFEDQLSCSKAKTGAGKYYNQLRESFENFQRFLKKAAIEEEQSQVKNKRQATMHDMFSKR